MSKTVVIHQPDFMPYMGFFHRFLKADVYVVLDHVQFVYGSRGWTHRDKIKTPNGPQWLTISVEKAPRSTPINEIVLSDQVDWRQRHLAVLKQNYSRAPYFAEVWPHLEALYAEPYEMLASFNLSSIRMLMGLFDIDIPLVISSKMDPKGYKNDLMVDLVKKACGTHYLSGVGARDYFDAQPFDEAGIEVVWQDFDHPQYAQLHGEFEPYLSSIDLLFNCGIDASRELLRSA